MIKQTDLNQLCKQKSSQWPVNITEILNKTKASSTLSEDRQSAGSDPPQDLGSVHWQTTSLGESWASVSNMESDLRSLETSEMFLLQEDHSENHSSTSDIINLEAEPHERAESDDEDLQCSVLSIDKELAEIEAHVLSSSESDLRPPQALELLMCVEEPIVQEIGSETAAEPVFTHTPLLSEPLDFTLASVPIPEIISQVLDRLPQSDESYISESDALSVSPDYTVSPVEEVTSKPDSIFASAFELPVILVGGAALAAVVGVLTYTLSRK